MNNYYKTNAIYEALKKRNHSFKWVIGNAWLLVYGDKDSNAKLIVFVCGKSWVQDNDFIKILNEISTKSKLPTYFIKFDDSSSTGIENVDFTDGSTPFTAISLNSLKDKFRLAGLNIAEGKCGKYLNDATSSAYHSWQRGTLGRNITVSDIDLIRMKKDEICEFIELKRSYFEVNKWSPFRDDFANFTLIKNFADKLKVSFHILYNQRITKPKFNDIYTPVSIFKYDKDYACAISRNVSFDYFTDGEYLKDNPPIGQKETNNPVCVSCHQTFQPKFNGALLCFECWKKQN